MLLQPVVISRNDKEKVLIEGSINSVRVSIAVKQVSVSHFLLLHSQILTFVAGFVVEIYTKNNCGTFYIAMQIHKISHVYSPVPVLNKTPKLYCILLYYLKYVYTECTEIVQRSLGIAHEAETQ